MKPKPVDKRELLDSLPIEWPEDLLPEIRRLVQASSRKIAVLDDDPTGTQTVHGIPVLTDWSLNRLRGELNSDSPAFYLLTNSRSLTLTEAQALNMEIGRNLSLAAESTGHDFVVVSRSDSTLRGHFPGEVEALARALELEFDAWLINPFFLEGERYTIEDVHYVAEGDKLVPAGETEFARDMAFGYQASNLRAWVAEKMGGRIAASEVASISLDDIRRGGSARVTDKLCHLAHGRICVVNAASYRDMEVFVLGLLAAEASGRRFLYRTAASFVRVRAGIGPRSLLTRDELVSTDASGGGLIIVGSHVPRTSTQLNALIEHTDVHQVEINVQSLLEPGQQSQEIKRVVQATNAVLSQGEDVAIYTSRRLITGQDSASSLAIGRRVSDGLIAVMRDITVRPRFLIAKGGITASDIATKGLDVKKALVKGQILPGVPVWQLGPESRYPGMFYTVFPGNVGDSMALVDTVFLLSRCAG
jgi:uncharacterized protein YgbK (DUF1537 family)